MNYRYRVVEPFWTHFYRLGDSQKEAARRAWKIFKENPFDPGQARTRFTNCHRCTGAPFTRWTLKVICVPRFTLKGIGSCPWTSSRTTFTRDQLVPNSAFRIPRSVLSTLNSGKGRRIRRSRLAGKRLPAAQTNFPTDKGFNAKTPR